MDVYTVEQITEADFGCEESGRKEAAALLKLVSDTDRKYVEITESELLKRTSGIKRG